LREEERRLGAKSIPIELQELQPSILTQYSRECMTRACSETTVGYVEVGEGARAAQQVREERLRPAH
jgi:hypothetical protein